MADPIQIADAMRQRDATLSKAARGTGLEGGGGGDHTDGMEARIAKLEATTAHMAGDITELKADVRDLRKDMNTDFRWTWGGMLLACMLAIAGYFSMDIRVDGIERQMSAISAKLDQLLAKP